MDFVQWIQDELSSVPWILLGIAILFGGMFVSDIFTKTTDSFWEKKKDQR